jgi:hypothetical protein
MVTWNTDKKEDERNWIRITSNGGVEPSHSATTEQVSSHMMLGQKYNTVFRLMSLLVHAQDNFCIIFFFLHM